MSDGQLALNTNLVSPGLFFKDSNGDSVKIGPVHVGTTAPNVSPGVGGQAGNSKGEQWLDTSSSRYVFKIWDGTAWRSEDGEFVNASGDTMTGALVMDNQQQVRFRETTANGTNFIAIEAPASVTADRTLTLPDVTGTIVSTGDTGSVTSTMILDGTILNADINASAAIADTKLATISTAGKVSNSATTATNANTASAIVARDASGDFAAGDITISDKIIHAGDTNTAIRFPAADTVTVETAGFERARITSAGLVGIGTFAPAGLLNVSSNTAGSPSLTYNTSNIANFDYGSIQLALGINAAAPFGAFLQARDNTNAARVISLNPLGGNVGIGTVTPATALEVNGDITISDKIIHAGDTNTAIRFPAADTVTVETNGNERMRINSNGDILIGQSTTTTPGLGNNTVGICLDDAGTGFFSRAAAVGLRVNRTADGALVAFTSAGIEEGNISISGTTTSYNGAHLSRWSQLSNNAERIEILRGSVLSNIDEMCEWGEEDNEQLNRMKVSDVEGDKNVSGVFQDWDDDDETYTDDFYCAMTGDFIIRIAEGVTVERGDLLMSAGDGTAKPQDDDIIRSKTIAKVTSTNVSCTYADGSYCVPCVLMAC